MTTPSEPEYRTIPLTKGLVAIVDAADYEWLSQFNWHATRGNASKLFYAARTLWLEGGKKRTLLMHRAILGLPPEDHRQCDHRNGNRLDNRRANLRPATLIQNHANAPMRRTNTSGYKGVRLHKFSGLWHARITLNYREISLGYFKTPEAADAAYRATAKRIHGEFAHDGTC